MQIVNIIIMALMAEAIWETLKMLWQEGKVSIDRLGAIGSGVLLCVLAGIDIFAAVGDPLALPYIGYVLTGILISRGANFIHDLYKRIAAAKTDYGKLVDAAAAERGAENGG